ncbi:hypothetical protein K435DRAFT_799612 [Dendrothele bispora CBS 962.96]|uniref:DUF6532 domain-containing protein n=1 Tax=Dendrothele bispora (strain CBS 962.96) TaxID=1314807 RepID=A0A4S8LVF5_DENBC|nr:hypothetical protein K435DRAFT_799612 [Dendrothele bispora CBS 962.96]
MAPKSLSEILAMGDSTGPTQKQSNAEPANSLPPRGSKRTAMAKKVWVGAAKRGNAKADDNPQPTKKKKQTVVQRGKAGKHHAGMDINEKGGNGVPSATTSTGRRTTRANGKPTVTVVANPEVEQEINTDNEQVSDQDRYTPAEARDSDVSSEEYDIDETEVLGERAHVVQKSTASTQKRAPATENFEFEDDNGSNNVFPVIAPPSRPPSSRSVRSTTSAISEDDVAIPETDATISDASSAFNIDMDEDQDEGEDHDNELQTVKEPKTTSIQDTRYNAEVLWVSINVTTSTDYLQRPVLQAPQPQLTKSCKSTSKHSDSTLSHCGPQNSPNSQAVSAADSRNHGWDTSTYMTYPGSGKRYISKKEQPGPLGKVLSDAIDIALGLFLFRNAYPEPAEQQQMINLSLNTACTKHKQHHIANRIEQDRIESTGNFWFPMITHMRSKVKEIAAGLVGGLYEFMKLAPAERSTLVRGLLDRLAYVFPLNNPMQPSTWRSNEPYRHPAIIEVLKQAFFSQDSKSIGKRYEDNFQSTSPTDPAKEIPMPMLALAGVAIFAALKEWASGTRVNEDFAGIVMSEEYEKHISLCKGRIIGEDGSGRNKYHNMTTRLYREAKGQGTSTTSSELPEIDVDGME